MRILLIFLILIASCAHTPQQVKIVYKHKGEEKMATLIFDEQFPNGNVNPANNWTYANNPASFYEFDTELNKHVTYRRWTNGRTGLSDNSDGSATRRSIPLDQWQQGVTVYFSVKFHNFIYPGGGASHMLSPKLSNRGATSNHPGEMMIEVNRNNYSIASWPSNAFDTSRNFWASFDWAGRSPTYGELNVDNINISDYVEDDVWYEIVWFVDVDNGGSNGRTTLWYRRYGDSNWTEVFTHTGVQLIDVNDTSPLVGLTGYLHTNPSQNEVRSYLGWVTMWSGNAMADGDIGGDNGGDNGGDPLAISNHKVSITDTTAALTWTTNKPSNSVVDYGATETRGTIARDDNNVTDHTINLSGLTENTTYYYRFSSRTADGSETVMDQTNSTFVTKVTDNGGGTEPEPIEAALDDLTDVALDNPVEGQVLMYRGGKWVNIDAKPLVAQLVEDILNETSLVVNKPSA